MIGLRIKYIPRNSSGAGVPHADFCGWKVSEGDTPTRTSYDEEWYDRDKYDIDDSRTFQAREAATEYTKEHYPDLRVRDVVEIPSSSEFIATLTLRVTA